jgi:hypothetical protein
MEESRQKHAGLLDFRLKARLREVLFAIRRFCSWNLFRIDERAHEASVVRGQVDVGQLNDALSKVLSDLLGLERLRLG